MHGVARRRAATQNSLQLVLVKVLTDAEAEAAAESAQGALAHCETEAVEYLLNGGLELTAPIAAAPKSFPIC